MTLIGMKETRYSDDVIQVQRTHDSIIHQSLWFQLEFALTLCRFCFAKQ